MRELQLNNMPYNRNACSILLKQLQCTSDSRQILVVILQCAVKWLHSAWVHCQAVHNYTDHKSEKKSVVVVRAVLISVSLSL